MLDPVIKWSGSKRTQAKEIVARIGNNYDTYFEPFCGGCSVLFYILNNCPRKFKHFVCSDLNDELILTYLRIKEHWQSVFTTYRDLWSELNSDNNLERKKKMFADVRDELNKTHDPELFFFIMRTTTNGMPRYNSNGEFNNSFHVTRNGIEPKRILPILEQWSMLLNKHDVSFLHRSYHTITDVKANDFMYLDPPYANTKGMYFGTINYEELWSYLRKLPCDWMLSFDGMAGDENNIQSVPKDLYNEHILLNSGNSSFRRVIGNSTHTNVLESLYVHRNKEFSQVGCQSQFLL